MNGDMGSDETIHRAVVDSRELLVRCASKRKLSTSVGDFPTTLSIGQYEIPELEPAVLAAAHGTTTGDDIGTPLIDVDEIDSLDFGKAYQLERHR